MVQDELEAIFANLQATSLECERKHPHDKKNEASRLLTLARASRNATLRQHRTIRDAAMAKTQSPKIAELGCGIRAFEQWRSS